MPVLLKDCSNSARFASWNVSTYGFFAEYQFNWKIAIFTLKLLFLKNYNIEFLLGTFDDAIK